MEELPSDTLGERWTNPWHCNHARAARVANSHPKGSLVTCANTFKDKLLLDGSHSREHKGHTTYFDNTAESMYSA